MKRSRFFELIRIIVILLCASMLLCACAQGENGFGYDPLFLSDDLGVSLGVAPAEEKNKISHRFRALQQLREKIK